MYNVQLNSQSNESNDCNLDNSETQTGSPIFPRIIYHPNKQKKRVLLQMRIRFSKYANQLRFGGDRLL